MLIKSQSPRSTAERRVSIQHGPAQAKVAQRSSGLNEILLSAGVVQLKEVALNPRRCADRNGGFWDRGESALCQRFLGPEASPGVTSRLQGRD